MATAKEFSLLSLPRLAQRRQTQPHLDAVFFPCLDRLRRPQTQPAPEIEVVLESTLRQEKDCPNHPLRPQIRKVVRTTVKNPNREMLGEIGLVLDFA